MFTDGREVRQFKLSNECECAHEKQVVTSEADVG